MSSASLASEPNQYHQPTESYQAVWRLFCKHCNSLWSSRGMEAMVNTRPAIRCFSTDLPPLGCDVVYPPLSNSLAGLVAESSNGSFGSMTHYARRFDIALTGPCHCHVQDVACLGCGNIVGYYIHRPCFRCLSYRLRIKARGYQHLWTFYQENVSAVQRKDDEGVPLGWHQLTMPNQPRVPSLQTEPAPPQPPPPPSSSQTQTTSSTTNTSTSSVSGLRGYITSASQRYIGAGTRTRSSHNVFGSRNNANSPPPSLGIDIPAYARSMARRYPSDSGLATQRSNDNHSTIALSESTIAPSQREIQSSALEEQMEDVHNTGNNDISEEQVDMELDDEVMENTHTSERGSATDISISTNDGQLWQRPDSQQFTRQSVRSTSARYSTLPPQLDSQAASARRSVSNPRVSRQSQFESGYSSSHQESGGYGANNPQSTAHGAYQQVIEGEYVEGEVLGAANSSSSNALSRRSQSGGRQARSRSNRNNLRLNLSNNLTVGATATRELPLTPITPSSSSQTASLDNTNISVQAILSESSTANRENNRPVSPVSIRRVTPSSSYNQLGSDSARINGLPSQQPQGEANSGPPTTTTSVSILHSNSDISPNNGTLTSNAPAMVAAPDYSSESKSKLLMNPPGLSHWLMQSGIESMAKWEMLTIAR